MIHPFKSTIQKSSSSFFEKGQFRIMIPLVAIYSLHNSSLYLICSSAHVIIERVQKWTFLLLYNPLVIFNDLPPLPSYGKSIFKWDSPAHLCYKSPLWPRDGKSPLHISITLIRNFLPWIFSAESKIIFPMTCSFLQLIVECLLLLISTISVFTHSNVCVFLSFPMSGWETKA